MNFLNSKAKDSNFSTEMKFTHLKAYAKQIRKCSEVKRQINIVCDRQNPWYSSLGELLKYTGEEFAKGDVTVTFLNEEGVDSGALLQEWITLMLSTVAKPEFGLFEFLENKVNMGIYIH